MSYVVTAFAATGRRYSVDIKIHSGQNPIGMIQVEELDQYDFCDSFDKAVYALFEEVTGVDLQKNMNLIMKMSRSWEAYDRMRSFKEGIESQYEDKFPFLFDLLETTWSWRGTFEYGTEHFAAIHGLVFSFQR